MARSNMDKKKADEEIRRKESQLQDLSAKYQSLQASHMKIVDLKDELEQIYSSKSAENCPLKTRQKLDFGGFKLLRLVNQLPSQKQKYQ